MIQLTAGANTALSSPNIEIRIKQHSTQGAQADVSAYALEQSTQKVRGDQDMIFYGQTSTASGSIRLQQNGSSSTFQLDLSKIEPVIAKIAVSATLDAPFTFAALQRLEIELFAAGQLIASAVIEGQGKTEAALIVGEFYRHQQGWKFRLVAQGFNGGLKPLAEHFGVEIQAEPTPTPTPPPTPIPTPAPIPVPAPRVNLSKITLDKQNSKINLTKQAQGFGEIKVNLNWNKKGDPTQKVSFLKSLTGGKSGVDLDLGCLFEMQDGSKSVIQALGNCFGTFNQYPYIQLSADDRSGASSDGEWLKINGQHWDQIKRIVIFAFIYEGAPNWAATDGVVTIYVPNQPPIEIQLTEGGDRLRMCGIAELSNHKGEFQVSRQVKYVAGHRELDQHFGIGLQWKSGSKD